MYYVYELSKFLLHRYSRRAIKIKHPFPVKMFSDSVLDGELWFFWVAFRKLININIRLGRAGYRDTKQILGFYRQYPVEQYAKQWWYREKKKLTLPLGIKEAMLTRLLKQVSIPYGHWPALLCLMLLVLRTTMTFSMKGTQWLFGVLRTICFLYPTT